jgi:hypothetical protein
MAARRQHPVPLAEVVDEVRRVTSGAGS